MPPMQNGSASLVCPLHFSFLSYSDLSTDFISKYDDDGDAIMLVLMDDLIAYMRSLILTQLCPWPF